MGPRRRYLELLKDALAYRLWPPAPSELGYFDRSGDAPEREDLRELDARLRGEGYAVMKLPDFTEEERDMGSVFPRHAVTMMGRKRLDNLQKCVQSVLRDGVPGDLIETGVWRGGGCILMKAVLEMNGDTERRVFVADSFEGLPPPEDRAPLDAQDRFHEFDFLRVSEEEVRANFRKFGLLDDRVVFLKGFFADTLPGAPIERLSVLRLDGDMYASTIDALEALYPKLQPGGYCIVDDWALLPCAKAVIDYREAHGITEEIHQIDDIARYWRKA